MEKIIINGKILGEICRKECSFDLVYFLRDNGVLDYTGKEEIFNQKNIVVKDPSRNFPMFQHMKSKFDPYKGIPFISTSEFLRNLYDMYGCTWLVQFSDKEWVITSSHSSENETSFRSIDFDPEDVFDKSVAAITVVYDSEK